MTRLAGRHLGEARLHGRVGKEVGDGLAVVGPAQKSTVWVPVLVLVLGNCPEAKKRRTS